MTRDSILTTVFTRQAKWIRRIKEKLISGCIQRKDKGDHGPAVMQNNNNNNNNVSN